MNGARVLADMKVNGGRIVTHGVELAWVEPALGIADEERLDGHARLRQVLLAVLVR